MTNGPGARVIYIGKLGDLSTGRLEIGRAYTVTWSGGYLGDIRIRLAEVPGFTFLRALFVVVA